MVIWSGAVRPGAVRRNDGAEFGKVGIGGDQARCDGAAQFAQDPCL
jgi:hypothetical protein